MIQTAFWNYQTTAPWFPTEACSVGLRKLLDDASVRWPELSSLGCFGVRPVRGGTAPSSHSYGAAIDIAFKDPTGATRDQLCGYLVAWSREWSVQAIHDYQRSRIWRAGRTPLETDACTRWWRAQRKSSNGMGQSWAHWIHVEVHPEGWHDDRSAGERGIT